MGIINIAVVVSGLDEEYPYNIIRGIRRSAGDHNINVSVFAAFGGVVNSKKFDIGEFSIYNLIDFSKFDGALMLSNTFSDPVLRGRITSKVKAAGIPAVIFECDDHQEFYNISIDNYSVMYKLTEHVIKKHGAKVINYISGPLANPEAQTRYEAVQAALRDNGLTLDERRFYHGFFRSYDGIKAIEAFQESGLPLPDAFICANDSMALTAISSLEKLGYKVPDDVIVTGFDNTFSAKNSSPELTTVERPLYQSGYKACEIIYDLVTGKERPRKTVLEATPVFSESCGCQSTNMFDLASYKKRTYTRIENNNNNVHMINRLTAGLAETATPEDCFKVITGMINELECDMFCLCLTEDWESDFNTSSLADENSTYAENMTAPIVWRNGEVTSVKRFKSSDMFPVPQETGGNINYFLPLHFGERCLGYYIISNSDFPIYSLLCHSLAMAISNSVENISKLSHIRKAMEELDHLYVIDPLCNIYNRNGFINRASEMFDDSLKNHKPLMLCFIDMDGLKSINDNYGHNEGDFALQRFAAAINKCCDTSSICARVGGDEFVVCSTNGSESSAKALASRIEQSLNDINTLTQKPYTLSASIGSVIKVVDENDTLNDLLEKADEKMYVIKRRKKKQRMDETNI
ncbi:MAG: GGDEF domain-containing protein [Ruminococcus sp.]|nr:GGDEF domain-containing protein [Ruminococcus sp.]